MLNIINKLTAFLQVRPFEFARKADVSQILNVVQKEHPQIIALIISYLEPVQAAMVLSELPQDLQADIIARIANVERTSPEYIKEIERIFESKLSSIGTEDYAIVGGLQTVVDILNAVDRGTEKHILNDLEVTDEELADQIKKRMFVFEDIVKLDNRAIQKVLKEIENSDLVIALKGTTPEVKKVLFANISTRLQEMLTEDMEFMGPVRLKDVEEAQQKIANVIRKLEDDNEIVVTRGEESDVFV